MISQQVKSVILRVLHLVGIRFRSMEVIRPRNVGELQALVDRKTVAAV